MARKPKEDKTKEVKISAKEKALELALGAIEKAHGKGAVMVGKKGSLPGVEFRSSGCFSMDLALGGGWGKGRVVELYGPESSGKTTLALHAIAAAQKRGDVCAFIDVEHSLDPSYAAALGVNMEDLLVSQPSSGEQALQIAETLINSSAVSIVVIDSVAALLPQAEIAKEIGESVPGRQASLMSQAMRKLPRCCALTGTTLMFINQIRMKIGIMFGSPETTSGGQALKFYASQRLDVRRIGGVKEGDKLVANRTRVKIVKNKLATPFQECEFNIEYGKGIDIAGDFFDIATDIGIVDKSGAWYSYGGDRLGQGRSNAVNCLKENHKSFKEITDRVKLHFGIGVTQ